MGTCILGIAFGMDEAGLSIFVNSARMSGYMGDMVLLGDTVSPDTQRFLDNNFVDFRDGYERPAPFFRGRWALYPPVLKVGGWDRVLIADTRDVVFQGIPKIGDGLNVTQESACIGQEGYNTEWVKKWGNDVFERIKHHPILCAGTVWGDPDSLIHLSEFIRDNEGMDQGSLNVAIRGGRWPAIIHPNGEIVWTLGLEGYDFETQTMGVLLHQMIQGKLAMPDDHVPPIVHQYDRHKFLSDYYQSLYG